MSTPLDMLNIDTADEGAAIGLLALVYGISEEFWCAGWMDGIDYRLWRIAPGTQYGQGVISERQATLLILLSEEARGWWTWRGAGMQSGPMFVTTEEWLTIYDAARPLQRSRPTSVPSVQRQANAALGEEHGSEPVNETDSTHAALSGRPAGE